MKLENRKTHVFKLTLSLLHVSSLSVALFTTALFFMSSPRSVCFAFPHVFPCMYLHLCCYVCIWVGEKLSVNKKSKSEFGHCVLNSVSCL